MIEKLLQTKAAGFYRFCLNNTLYSSLLAILIAFTISFILLIPAYVINRWFPWVLGRRKRS